MSNGTGVPYEYTMGMDDLGRIHIPPYCERLWGLRLKQEIVFYKDLITGNYYLSRNIDDSDPSIALIAKRKLSYRIAAYDIPIPQVIRKELGLDGQVYLYFLGDRVRLSAKKLDIATPHCFFCCRRDSLEATDVATEQYGLMTEFLCQYCREHREEYEENAAGSIEVDKKAEIQQYLDDCRTGEIENGCI